MEMKMNKQTVPIKRPYQRCTRCVMDTTDSKITFDENGVWFSSLNEKNNPAHQAGFRLIRQGFV